MNNSILKKIVIAGAVLAAMYFVARPLAMYMFAKALRGGGGEAKQTLGQLDMVRSALQIYYQDTEGKYPASLETLAENGKYLTSGEIPKARIFGKKGGEDFAHLHSGSETKVKLFRSPKEADDAGGWGYVADPSSPEYGTAFINCTHLYMGSRNGRGYKEPWNSF